MSRPLRIHLPGMPYHLCSRGNRKECIFEDDADHERFLEVLAHNLKRFQIFCVAYCLMWNHYHLLLVPAAHSVSRLMQQLNSRYCQQLNRRHHRVGHVLQGRFTARIIDNDAYLLTAFRYIARNPVVAGRSEQPEDWRWSSYGATIGVRPIPSFLCFTPLWKALDTADPTIGRERLITFMSADSVGDGMATLNNSLLLGGRSLGEKVDPLLPPHRRSRDFTYVERYATRPSLVQLLGDIESQDQLEEAIWTAFGTHAYTLTEIAAVVQRPPGTIWSWIRRMRRDRSPTAAAPRERRSRGQISIFE
jgi:putative transposase